VADFHHITITGIDKVKTHKPSAETALYRIYFTLSADPPGAWGEIFQAERRFPRHSMWRHAWVEGSCIVIECVPEEVEQYHLKDITEDVRNTNEKFVQWQIQQVTETRTVQERQDADRLRVDNILDRLKF
jgi:transposase